jgi:hypothetical protein
MTKAKTCLWFKNDAEAESARYFRNLARSVGVGCGL